MVRMIALTFLALALIFHTSCSPKSDVPQKAQDTREKQPTGHTDSSLGFGAVTGTIVIDAADGESIPKLRTLIEVKKAPVDVGCCAAEKPILDESLLVDPNSRGLKNVFVYLKNKPDRGKRFAKSQSSWPTAAPTGKTLILSRENCTYHPHAMIVKANENFTIQSQDPIVHSYKGRPMKNRAFNFGVPPGSKETPFSLEVNVFPQTEDSPVFITDAMHNWMSAYQLPLDHPYAAVTDTEGRFTISDLPSGTHDFTIWHEKGNVLFEAYSVEVSADKTTDIGEISVQLSQLGKK